jgi:hypothetical protein
MRRGSGAVHMRKAEDLTGRTFGRWTVVREASISVHGQMWECQCACGSPATEVLGASLKRGGSKSCGCARIHSNRKRFSRARLSREVDYGSRFSTEAVDPAWDDGF